MTSLDHTDSFEGKEAPRPLPAYWSRLERLIDAHPRLPDLHAHRIELPAARRWRELGMPIPEELREHELAAAVVVITAPILLERVRAAYSGTIVLIKGPEIAARYPDPALRSFGDIDLLVDAPELAQQALLKAGFVRSERRQEHPVPRYHLEPLVSPGLPLEVELHRTPNFPRRLATPRAEPFFRALQPSATGVQGISTLPPATHAVVLAVHSWCHFPLGRVRDMVDIAALLPDVEREEALSVARELGVERLWKATLNACEALLLRNRPPTLAERTWARSLWQVRDRTVFESHLENWVSSFWILPPARALGASATALARELAPGEDETWRSKLHRTRLALWHAFMRKTQHDQALRDRRDPPEG
jgi:Uncharacterised nucleotidyltransferase